MRAIYTPRSHCGLHVYPSIRLYVPFLLLTRFFFRSISDSILLLATGVFLLQPPAAPKIVFWDAGFRFTRPTLTCVGRASALG